MGLTFDEINFIDLGVPVCFGTQCSVLRTFDNTHIQSNWLIAGHCGLHIHGAP